MAMEGTLKSRDGKLYVLYTYDEFSEPFRQFLWWRVLETRGSGYGERPAAGDIATSTGHGGEWKTRNPSTHRTTGSVSTGSGSTQAETVERVGVDPPPARGKELRWRDGRWEKLTARGWLPAGEGKAKTSRKSTSHAAKRRHAAKRTRAPRAGQAWAESYWSGRRVEVPVVTDAWMRGDRYGTVVKVTQKRALAPSIKARGVESVTIAHVLLDKSGRIERFPAAMLKDA